MPNVKMYYDQDADSTVLKDKNIGVIGYGIQGRAQALNLRDSGFKVRIGNRDDEYRKTALEDGFDVDKPQDLAEWADVVLFLIDSAVPVSQVDKQLSLEIQKHFKPCVVVINKWDLAEQKHTEEEYIEYLDGVLQGLSYAPIVFISATEGEGMREVVAMGMNLYEQSGHRVTTGELNRLFETILERHSPASKLGKRAKIFYVTQTEVHPPTIAVFVNNPDMFDPSYQRYLLNQLRDELPYSEVPIKLMFRGKQSYNKLKI